MFDITTSLTFRSGPSKDIFAGTTSAIAPILSRTNSFLNISASPIPAIAPINILPPSFKCSSVFAK